MMRSHIEKSLRDQLGLSPSAAKKMASEFRGVGPEHGGGDACRDENADGDGRLRAKFADGVADKDMLPRRDTEGLDLASKILNLLWSIHLEITIRKGNMEETHEAISNVASKNLEKWNRRGECKIELVEEPKTRFHAKTKSLHFGTPMFSVLKTKSEMAVVIFHEVSRLFDRKPDPAAKSGFDPEATALAKSAEQPERFLRKLKRGEIVANAFGTAAGKFFLERKEFGPLLEANTIFYREDLKALVKAGCQSHRIKLAYRGHRLLVKHYAKALANWGEQRTRRREMHMRMKMSQPSIAMPRL
jgi:hypothetical protein